MDAAQIVAWVACARRLGMLARAFGAICILVTLGAISATTAHASERTFAPTMGVVRAPLLNGINPHHQRRKPDSKPVAGASGGGLTLDFTGKRLSLRRSISYRTSSGENIVVSVSARYSADTAADRLLVDYVSSLLHGDEISGLRLMVLRGDEIARKCGVGTAACYFPGSDTIVVVGEDRYGGLPTDYVLAHEYGHRIAHYRYNPPFRGGAFWNGPKYWASYEGVCTKLKRGQLSLARSAYWNFPGENFAEAYARYHVRGQVRWQYAPSLKPDAGAYKAIEKDIVTPWLDSHVIDVTRTLGPGQEKAFRIKTPRDGRLTADLYSQDSGRFRVELRRSGRRVTGSPRPTRDFRISRMICGQAEFSLVVRAVGSGGRYRLVIARP